MSIVEEHFEKISTLHIDVNRQLGLIKELDQKVQKYNEELQLKQNVYLSNLKNPKEKKQDNKKQDNKQSLAEIHELQKEVLKLTKEKIQISDNLYELLDMSINKLDKCLQKHENELSRFKQEKNKSDLNDSDDLISNRSNNRQLKQSNLIKLEEKQKHKDYNSSYKQKNKKQEKSLFFQDSGDLDNIATHSNEPTYCYCNRVSFGNMLACDNQMCPKEWFHFECAKIKQQPKGAWYCDDCKKLNEKNLI